MFFFYYFDSCVLDPLVFGGLTPFCRSFPRFCRHQTCYQPLIEIERFWCVVVVVVFFKVFSYQLMSSLSFVILSQNFCLDISLSFHSVLVYFRVFLFAACLHTTNPQSVWSPVPLNPLRAPPHESRVLLSPAKIYPFSVCPPTSIRTLLTIFFVFPRVSSHYYTHQQPSTPIHT